MRGALPEETPSSIRQSGARELEIMWMDGHASRYPVAYLRRSCSCAACVDERTGIPILKPEDVPDDVRPVRIDQVGRYAIQFHWSDGHATGIYSFDRLRALCPCPGCTGTPGEREPHS